MRVQCPWSVVIAALVTFALPAHAEPLEFSGYLASQTETRFLLTDLADGTRSGWLGIGGAFRGYTLTRYDPGAKSVFLRKGAETLRLAIKESKTGDVAAALLSERTISFSDDGDFYIGEFPVDASTLTDLLRQLTHVQPEGMIELAMRWTAPGGSVGPKVKTAVSKLEPVLKALGEDGRRFQIRLPRN